MGVSIALTILMPSLIIASLVWRTVSSQMVDAAGERVRDLVTSSARLTVEFLKMRNRDLLALAKAPTLCKGSPQEIEYYLREVIRVNPSFFQLLIVDAQGLIQASSSSEITGTFLCSYHPELRDKLFQAIALAPDAVVISSLANLGPKDLTAAVKGNLGFSELDFQILCSIRPPGSGLKRILVGIVEMEALKHFIADLDRDTPGTEYSCLLDREGRILITHDPNMKVFSTFPGFKRLRLEESPLTNADGFQECMGPNGDRIILGYACYALPGTFPLEGRILIAYSPYSLVTAPARDLMRKIRLIVGATLLLGLFFGLGLSLRLARPIQNLAVAVQEIEVNRLDATFPVTGPKETRVLGSALNRLVARLRRHEQIQEEVAKERERAQKAAEDANKAKSDFLASMSHEIRTPLNGAIGSLSLLTDLELGPGQRELVGIASQTTQSLLRLVNSILDFSRIEARMLEIVKAPFDIVAALENVTGFFEAPVKQKGLELVVRYPMGGPRRFLGDQDRLQQMLINLIGNSVKFTEQGHISIEMVYTPGNGDSTQITISVRDTGLGIPPDLLPNVFDRFVRGTGVVARRVGGTGLGLAITKNLAELMGGSVSVQSEVGLGSCFAISIPLQPLPDNPSETPAYPSLVDRKILIVDDLPLNREFVLELVTTWRMRGSVVDSACKAVDGVRLARETGDPYEMVLIDHEMPGMDGLALGQTLRADPMNCDLLLILLTSDTSSQRISRQAAETFNGVARKPLRSSQLLETLHTVSQRRAPIPKDSVPSGMEEPRDSRTVGRSGIRHRTPLKVLVADDNEINQRIAQLQLEFLGCQVDLTDDGAPAVRLVLEKHYDLVFMDCEMPNMNGFVATTQIHAQVQGHAPPIVALTAQALKGDREKCLTAGMDDYLSKPILPPDFEAILRRWCPLESGATESPETGDKSGDRPEVGSEPGSDESPIDGTHFDSLQEVSRESDSDVLEKMVDLFVTEGKGTLEALEGSLKKGDSAESARLVHRLAGASLNLGANVLARQCRKTEEGLKRGDLVLACQDALGIRKEYARAVDDLIRRMGGKET